MQVVTFAVIDRGPVGKDLGAGVRAARVERCSFGLRSFQDFAEHLAARSLVETRSDLGFLDCLEDPDSAQPRNVRRVFRDIEAHSNVALSAEMVNLVRLDVPQQLHQVEGVGQIPVVEEEPLAVDVGILIEMIDAAGIECARAPDNAVDFISFAKQEFGEVRPILAGDSRDQSFLTSQTTLLLPFTRLRQQTSWTADLIIRQPARWQKCFLCFFVSSCLCG